MSFGLSIRLTVANFLVFFALAWNTFVSPNGHETRRKQGEPFREAIGRDSRKRAAKLAPPRCRLKLT